MKMFDKLFFVFLLFLCIKADGQAQQKNSLDTLAGYFIRDLRAEDREQIILQTDKWYYIAGEDLWFSAYCISSLSHKISRHSKIVFADLVNDNDSIIARLLLNSQSQKPEGKIFLPFSLPEGYYWLRAFTRNILRKDTNDISVQPVYVFNSKKMAPQPTVDQIKTYDASLYDASQPKLTFFPEGGALISGTNTTIALQALDKNGMPLDVSGYVTDSWDSVVAKFKTIMPGLGKFSFFVWKSRKYTAHINWDGGREYSYPLPLVNQYASQLSVIEQNDKYIHAQVSLGDSIYKKNKLSYLLAVSRDSLCFAAVGKDMYDFTIPVQNFLEGKATLLLFNEDREIVSERNIYIEKNNPSVIMTTDKKKYGPREKAKLDIEALGSNNTPVLALLSVAITDDSLAKECDGLNRLALLKNDDIELPLAPDSSGISVQHYSPEQWDLVMLTQKSNYAQGHFVNNNYDSLISILDADSSIGSINGKVVDGRNKPVQKRVVTMFTNNNEVIFKTDTTDVNGRFHFRVPNQQDSVQFILQVADMKGRLLNEKIIVDTFPYPDFHTPAHLEKKFDPQKTEVLKSFKTYQLSSLSFGIGKGWLKPVIVKGVKKKELNYDDSKRVSQFSKILTSDKFAQGAVGNVTHALLMVPGVHLINGKIVLGATLLTGMGASKGGSEVYSSEPLLVVDGMIIDPTAMNGMGGVESSLLLNYIESIPPSTIDFIEVLIGADAGIYGMNGGHGVILINTTSKLRTNNEAIGLMKYTPKGYFNAPLFEGPNYDNKEVRRSSNPDQRSTIYWNGNVLTDSTGKANLHFFTADAPSSYTIHVAGITIKGEIIDEKIKIFRQ